MSLAIDFQAVVVRCHRAEPGDALCSGSIYHSRKGVHAARRKGWNIRRRCHKRTLKFEKPGSSVVTALSIVTL
jgi:hypothetical protein